MRLLPLSALLRSLADKVIERGVFAALHESANGT